MRAARPASWAARLGLPSWPARPGPPSWASRPERVPARRPGRRGQSAARAAVVGPRQSAARPASWGRGQSAARPEGEDRPPVVLPRSGGLLGRLVRPGGFAARRVEPAVSILQASSMSSVETSRSRSSSAMARGRSPPGASSRAGRPVFGADQDHREVADLARLNERQRLEQLVEGAEATGEDGECVGVLDEHHLAGEEVPELDAQIDVWVHRLLVRQLDVAADRKPPASWQPRLAASMMPGPPPVITAKPSRARFAASSRALA